MRKRQAPPETTWQEDLIFLGVAAVVIPTIFFIIVFIVKLFI